MATFTYNDFVTDDIPECPLTNSHQVRQAAANILQDNVKINDIQLIGIAYNNEIMYEWLINIEIENEAKSLPLPLYLPKDPEKAAYIIKVHSEIVQYIDLPEIAHIYKPDDYILIDHKYPCQIKLDKHNNLCIKRFEMFASQKIIQEYFMSVLGCELVTATMVVINMHSLCYKNLHDIGWLINMDGIPSLTSLDRRYTNLGFFIIDGFDELPKDTVFGLNSQKYIVTEDNENGQFIAKVSKKGQSIKRPSTSNTIMNYKS